MKEIAVFGLGTLGKSLAISYSNMGGKVIAIDKSQEKVDEISDYVTFAIRADLTEENVIKGVGVDEIVYPESETGIRMAKNLAHGEKFMDIAEISDTFSIIEAKVPESWVGKNLMELSLRKKYKFNIIAIKKEGKYKINPDVNIPFKHGMHLVVLGETEKMAKVFK